MALNTIDQPIKHKQYIYELTCIFSNMKLNEYDPGYNPRVLTLQNKWRVVWRMSLDRKKNLQDALDNLLEVCIKTQDRTIFYLL